MKNYLSCAETAKMIRQVLKESFPGVKFSVKSSTYSMGASITVRYQDGPTADAVKSVVSIFEASYFDGMQDYKGQRYSAIDGQEVRFGADYVFVNRSYSVEFLTVMARDVCQKYGMEIAYDILDSQYSGAYIAGANAVVMPCGRYFPAAVGFACAEVSMKDALGATIQPSATLARITSLGDDGYGQGCVGRLAA